jgi:hypothetical protein
MKLCSVKFNENQFCDYQHVTFRQTDGWTDMVKLIDAFAEILEVLVRLPYVFYAICKSV